MAVCPYGNKVAAVCSTLTFCMLALLTARLYTRKYVVKSFGADDIFMCLGGVSYLAADGFFYPPLIIGKLDFLRPSLARNNHRLFNSFLPPSSITTAWGYRARAVFIADWSRNLQIWIRIYARNCTPYFDDCSPYCEFVPGGFTISAAGRSFLTD